MREGLQVVGERVEGPGAERASVAWARADEDDGVVVDIEPVAV